MLQQCELWFSPALEHSVKDWPGVQNAKSPHFACQLLAFTADNLKDNLLIEAVLDLVNFILFY